MTTVRICVCGDAGTGKSSLIAGLVKDTFISGRIQSVLPQITIPPVFGTGEKVTTVIVDTSALPEHRDTLNREIKKANVILLVYSDHYSYERLGLFWLPHFRSLGVNVPVILCAAKSDAPDTTGTGLPVAAAGSNGVNGGHGSQDQQQQQQQQQQHQQDQVKVFEEETLPLMSEFKEVDSCIRSSAKEKHNVREAFFLCQKAVTHPVAPLYDSKEQNLKLAAVVALRRIFWLADNDKDGYLSDFELQAFQARCFGKPLDSADLDSIKRIIEAQSPNSVSEIGIDCTGFLLLNKYFIDKGRHETVWIILRAYYYTDSLSLREAFLHPKFQVPAFSSAELSPAGYQFFFDLFLRFDRDKDGRLNADELASLFAPTPGLPRSWTEDATSPFPSSTVRDEEGQVTLQGWLAQWSMTTFASPRTTLEYLAYFGFEPVDPRSGSNGGAVTGSSIVGGSSSSSSNNNNSTTTALKITKPRKRSGRSIRRVERNVVHAYLVGAPGSGKSSLLDAFLSRPFSTQYRPTAGRRVAVNSVELPGGKQCYLILEELAGSAAEEMILGNASRLLEEGGSNKPSNVTTITTTTTTSEDHTPSFEMAGAGSDLLICAYDSSNATGFAHISHLRTRYPHLARFPAMVLALKADDDRAVQHSDQQPDDYCVAVGLQKPHHVSVLWKSIGELFVTIADTALRPGDVLPRLDGQRGGRAGGMGVGGGGGNGGGNTSSSSGVGGGGFGMALGLLGEEYDGLRFYLGLGAVVAVGAAGLAVWRKSRNE